jgi:hypothetical protein
MHENPLSGLVYGSLEAKELNKLCILRYCRSAPIGHILTKLDSFGDTANITSRAKFLIDR